MKFIRENIYTDKFITESAQVFDLTFLDENGQRLKFLSNQFSLTENSGERFVFKNTELFDGE
ncbi:MAG: hypothetical protein J5852_01715, partial [Clostridia bacterium]|nr:hypothetical protein [Clostridia bacterium]